MLRRIVLICLCICAGHIYADDSLETIGFLPLNDPQMSQIERGQLEDIVWEGLFKNTPVEIQHRHETYAHYEGALALGMACEFSQIDCVQSVMQLATIQHMVIMTSQKVKKENYMISLRLVPIVGQEVPETNEVIIDLSRIDMSRAAVEKTLISMLAVFGEKPAAVASGETDGASDSADVTDQTQKEVEKAKTIDKQKRKTIWPAEKRAKMRRLGWILSGLGGAGLGIAGVTAFGLTSRSEDPLSISSTYEERIEQQESGIGIYRSGLLIGSAMTITGVTLLILEQRHSPEE